MVQLYPVATPIFLPARIAVIHRQWAILYDCWASVPPVSHEFAGGDAHQLIGPLADTLAAISLGASSLGTLTYIGNAPNLMIYAMAVERGIAMPSFFAFMGWSGAVLLPAFALVGWLYFS